MADENDRKVIVRNVRDIVTDAVGEQRKVLLELELMTLDSYELIAPAIRRDKLSRLRASARNVLEYLTGDRH